MGGWLLWTRGIYLKTFTSWVIEHFETDKVFQFICTFVPDYLREIKSITNPRGGFWVSVLLKEWVISILLFFPPSAAIRPPIADVSRTRWRRLASRCSSQIRWNESFYLHRSFEELEKKKDSSTCVIQAFPATPNVRKMRALRLLTGTPHYHPPCRTGSQSCNPIPPHLQLTQSSQWGSSP